MKNGRGILAKMMKKILMHKNIEVAAIECENGRITGLGEIFNKQHMPVGTYAPGFTRQFCQVYLQAWQRSRAVPEDRLNLADVVRTAGANIYQLGELSHGMALTDCYWMKSLNEGIRWEEINFHTNGFEPSLLTLTGSGEATATPDYETNGCLPKAWWVLDDVPVLIKDAPPWLPTASANEVVASQLADACGINHAIYFPVTFGEQTLCASVNFIDSDEVEFVSLQAYKRTHRGQSLQIAKDMGMEQNFLDTMTAFDLLVGNTDRHEGNFGMLMDPDTMSFVGPAPLFDSGTCLHGTQPYENGEFKPFYNYQGGADRHLQNVPFEIPSSDIIRGTITEAYDEFGLQQYSESAIREACTRASFLEERQMSMQREYQEEDICL